MISIITNREKISRENKIKYESTNLKIVTTELLSERDDINQAHRYHP